MKECLIASICPRWLFCISRSHKSDKAHRSDACWRERWLFTDPHPHTQARLHSNETVMLSWSHSFPHSTQKNKTLWYFWNFFWKKTETWLKTDYSHCSQEMKSRKTLLPALWPDTNFTIVAIRSKIWSKLFLSFLFFFTCHYHVFAFSTLALVWLTRKTLSRGDISREVREAF